MGSGMAARLVGAGFRVTVWNRTPGRCEPLRELGASVAESPRAAAADADAVVCMVADDAASRTVWLGETGALASIRPGTVVIECSTLSPAWIDELNRAASDHACLLLDAPVTGSRTQAETGQLLFLVGGEREALGPVRPVFAAMGRDTLHLGPLGSGARMKLVNNFLCGVQAAALAEAVTLVEQSGLDRDLALAVLQNGAPGSPLVKAALGRMAAQDYAVNFKLALMRKDLGYAVAEAQRHGVPLNTAHAAAALFDDAMPEWADSDFSAVVEPLRRHRTP